MAKQSRSIPVMQLVLDDVAARLMTEDESLIRIPDICEATGVNYGSVYHHFGSRDGLIDAAYNELFTRLVEEDIVTLQAVADETEEFVEFVRFLWPMLNEVSGGADRVARRAVRVRVVAASLTRPKLRELIAASQARLTDEIARLIALGQDRGWITKALTPSSIAVMLQIAVFGRVLDDVSATPISGTEWHEVTLHVFSTILIQP
jgi:AcrR family transcriptional regulator